MLVNYKTFIMYFQTQTFVTDKGGVPLASIITINKSVLC